jgi:hypothetical protein
MPAYEWNFSDVNPPVHAWATIFLYRTEKAQDMIGNEIYDRDGSDLLGRGLYIDHEA